MLFWNYAWSCCVCVIVVLKQIDKVSLMRWTRDTPTAVKSQLNECSKKWSLRRREDRTWGRCTMWWLRNYLMRFATNQFSKNLWCWRNKEWHRWSKRSRRRRLGSSRSVKNVSESDNRKRPQSRLKNANGWLKRSALARKRSQNGC